MDAYSLEVFSSAGDVVDTPVRHSPALAGGVVEPPRQAIPGPRSFDLPNGIFVAMVIAYVGFLATMTFAFGIGEGMPLAIGICAVYLAMYFGTAAALGRVRTGIRQPKLAWSQLRQRGLDTESGRMSAGAVLGQVLIVPACVAGFGLAVLAIVSSL